jgi:integrase
LLDLAKHCDLDDAEAVKFAIASKKVKDSYKIELVKAYNYYAQHNSITWTKPRYRSANFVPNVPSKEVVEQLIASSSFKYSVIFRLLAETGAGPEELHLTHRNNVNFENETIKITGAKGHDTRIIKLKPQLSAMLRRYIANYQEDYPFPPAKFIGSIFRRYRTKLAKKLGDTKIKQYRCYDLRHYFGTTLYHKTKDILYVKQQMGHRKIESTLIYTHLINFNEDEYTSATAKTVQEICQLIEAGFDYVTDFDNVKLFKKRK